MRTIFKCAGREIHWLQIDVRKFGSALLLAGLALFSGEPVFAERYLTIEEARRLCFSSAEDFEAQVLRISPDQAKEIEERSGVKVYLSTQRIWLARRDNELLGVLIVDQVRGKHELIDYVVAISPSGKVQQVEILAYRESHGQEIRRRKWRAQFSGKTSDAPLRLNQDIYNISGATISCRNVTEGIKRSLVTFEIVGRPRLSGVRLPDAAAQLR